MIKTKSNIFHIKARYTSPLINLVVEDFFERKVSNTQLSEVITYFKDQIDSVIQDGQTTPFEATFWNMFKKELAMIDEALSKRSKSGNSLQFGLTTITIKAVKVKGFKA